MLCSEDQANRTQPDRIVYLLVSTDKSGPVAAADPVCALDRL